MEVRCPAKLIVTGEHAVLYTQTAVTCAINKFLTCSQSNEEVPWEHPLVAACLRDFFDYAKLEPRPVNFQIRTSIPSHSGLGSSSAFIVSLLLYLHRLFNVQLVEQEFLELAKKIEDVQHGKSSGIDIKTVYYGGICSFEKTPVPRQLQPADNLLHEIVLIHSGQARFQTGEVVGYVRENFGKDTALWNQFEQVGNAVRQAIEDGNKKGLSDAIGENQQLLQRIGIVGQRSMHFLRELRGIGLSAKVCGAGTIGAHDEGCGTLAIFHPVEADQLSSLRHLIEKFNYSMETVTLVQSGAKYDED